MMLRCLPALAALMLALPAGAQIYRCEAAGSVVFSDRPCGPDARAHQPSSAVSYIEPDENLPAQAEAARVFIEQRRERLAQRSHTNRRGPLAPAKEALAPETVYLPWPARHGHHPVRHPRASHPGAARSASERYSALNGPILGTRRSEPFRVRLDQQPVAGYRGGRN